MVRLLHARTQGVFEPTVALIERAERSTWYDLLNELRGDGPDRPRPRKRPL
jgi:hypothetical protein